MLTQLFSSASGLRRPTATGNTPQDRRRDGRDLLSALAVAGLCGALAGCSAMTSVEPTNLASNVKGIVHGGQQPISGATVQLIAPGTSGYGVSGGAGSILASTTTDGNGNFTLPSYTCPSGNVLVYILATGGNPGAGTNAAVAEAAVLGPCSGLSSIPFISISEVTTVAAAYTLAPFATVASGAASIGTSSTNLIGLKNAAAAALNLASLTTGQAPAANSVSGMTLPTAEMNTLADILASCVNSGVSGVASTTCASLFADATPPGGTAPTDTFQAAIDIALNPGNNESALYLLATPSAPFQPTLSSDPGDWALGIQYNGGIMPTSQGTQGIDIDAQGNAWVVLLGGGRGPTAVPSGLLEISPSGVVSPSTSAYLNTSVDPIGVAINSAGLVIVSDYSGNRILSYVPSGSSSPGFTFSPSPTNGPAGIAIDNHDSSFWVANYAGNTLSHFSVSGTQLTASSPLAAGAAPFGLAVDASSDVYAADSDTYAPGSTGSNSGITGYSPTGSGTYTGGNVSTGTATYPVDIAIDNGGNIWTAQALGVGKYTSSGTQLSPQGGYTANQNNTSDSLAIDGLNRTIVANNSPGDLHAGSVTVFTNSGTLISTANQSYGYFANNTIPVDPYLPKGLAIDPSGNVWITGNTPSGVTELIGLVAPVATPLSAQNAPTNRLGTRP